MHHVWQFGLIGLLSGSAYALLAFGVVAVYRGSGVLNLAQGALGMAGTYAFWESYDAGERLSLWLAIPLGIVFGSALGVVAFILAIYPLRRSTELARLIATLGVLLVVQGFAVFHYGAETRFVTPFLLPGSYEILGAVVPRLAIVLLVITTVLAIGLAALFRWTRLGLTATALRENPLAVAMIGVSPYPSGMISWGLGGALGAGAGIVLLSITGLSPSRLTTLMITGLAAALLARFHSFAVAGATGVVIGVLQSILETRYEASLVRSIPFLVIVIALVIGGQSLPGRASVEIPRLPGLGTGRIRPIVVLLATAVGVFGAFALSSTWSEAIITSSLFAIIGLSIVVVTGNAGQVSLAPMAIAGFASLITARAASSWGAPFLVSIVAGVAAAVLLGVLLGIPSVRVRGLNLAVATIGLSLAVETTLLGSRSLTGGVDGISVPQASFFGIDLEPGRHPDRFAAFCVILLSIASIGVANVRRSRSGRRYAAVRANERGAAALGISVAGAKLAAFALSSGLAGLAGALFTYRTRIAVFSQFTVFNSVFGIGLAIISGAGMVIGGVVVGFAWAGGVFSHFLGRYTESIESWLVVISGGVLIQVLIMHPEGLVPALSRGLRRVTSRSTVPPSESVAIGASTDAVDESRPYMRASTQIDGDVVLETRNLSVHYGHIVAVDDISFVLEAGRVLGLIGPNGAGKTSVVDALSGFADVAGGTVTFDGADVVGRRPVGLARVGLTRTFQNLELFEDLSVRENLAAAVEPRDRWAYLTNLVLPGRVRLPLWLLDAVADLGLTDYLDIKVSELPQGTRRMVAIARAIATDPLVVCLDEPAAGLNEAERRVLMRAVRGLADAGIAVLLIEHNVDVVATVSDVIIALDFGHVIAHGSSDEVLKDPAVRSAYLGSSAAVARVSEEAPES